MSTSTPATVPDPQATPVVTGQPGPPAADAGAGQPAPALTLEQIAEAVFDPAWHDYLPQAVAALEPYRARLEAAATDACNLISDHIAVREQSLADEKAALVAAVPGTVWNELHDAEPDVHRVLITVADAITQNTVQQLH